MTILDFIYVGGSTIFILAFIIFAVKYYNLLRLARNEYEKVKNIVGTIVLTFRRAQDTQSEKVDELAFQIEAVHSDTERLSYQVIEIENKIKKATEIVDPVSMSPNESIDYMKLKKEVDDIYENQQKLQKQVSVLQEQILKFSKEEKVIINKESKSFSELTETELDILQFLINEGAKSAPEVVQKIKKTREHTARLMKKLWQDGYIERDTHKIPYIYRVNKKLEHIKINELNIT